jgi:hypothetical protein
VCVVACGGHTAPAPPVFATSTILAGPIVAAESLQVAVTDSSEMLLAPGVTPRVVSSRGALDLIDSGGDVIVTDQLSIIRYAAARADFAVIPLPWDRQYAIISFSAINAADVLNAVHADARLVHSQCAPATDTVRQRIVYVASDSIARSLAERYVGSGAAQRAAALSQEAFDHELATESNSWYIVTRPAGTDSCLFGSRHALPLIETRSTLIVRRGAVGVAADTLGRPRLETRP